MQKLKDVLMQQTGLTANEWQLACDATDGIIYYLVEKQLVDSQSLAHIVAEIYQHELINLDKHVIKDENIPLNLFKKINAVPIKEDQHYHIAISDPSKFNTINQLQFLTEKPIKIYIGDHHQIKNCLKRFEQKSHAEKIKPEKFNIKPSSEKTDEPLANFSNNILKSAIEKKATDIHIEQYQDHARIRFRIDGLLTTIDKPAIHIIERLNTRIKIISQLDISEKRLPQDGHFEFNNVNIRISTCPTIYGEKIVLRLLPEEKVWKISDLKMSEEQERLFIKAISQPQGLILVTGPTGSGKTVTLYSALQYLLNEERNICTVEDPVEIHLSGINQVNINQKLHFNFSQALKTFLRQDPDIIMIGEIRDLDTAQIAIRAAQTGHLVLATLHTNNAIDTINRLINLGVPSYEIASQVSLITAQRLLRKKQGGYYNGRFAVHELLSIDNEIVNAISRQEKLSTLLDKRKFKTLRDSALNAVSNKLTTLDELHRVLGKT